MRVTHSLVIAMMHSASSPWARKITFLCDESTLSFSRMKNLATPYWFKVEALQMTLIGPDRARSITRFLVPRTCNVQPRYRTICMGQTVHTPSIRSSRSLRALSRTGPTSTPGWGTIIERRRGLVNLHLHTTCRDESDMGAGVDTEVVAAGNIA